MAEPFVHPTAIVDEGATIGDDTQVWHHCHIRSGAKVGHHSSLGKNVYVGADVRIGSYVKIQNNVSVYEGVTLEDDVFVGPSAVFTNDLLPRAQNPGWHVVPTVVGTGASIGANATIVCGHDIGPFAMVGAGSVVTHPVPAHALVVGTPARVAGWVCRCGAVVSRREFAPPAGDRCPACGKRWRDGE